MIYNDVTGLIGSTPLVRLHRLGAKLGCAGSILAKLERQNPGGSAKDRIALAMIRRAEQEGKLRPGGTIIEETSGNTGIGLASIAASLGYRCIIVMPDSMSMERRKLIAAYGAELVLTPGAEGMAGAVKKAQELNSQIPGSIIAGQFDNEANPEAHYRTTGPEIWKDTGGKVDILVSAVGTGGTISGAGRYLKEQNGGIRVIAVEPDKSPLLSGGEAAPHGIQGIGANFIPDVLDRNIYDEVYRCSDEDAFSMMRLLARTEGILCGISSGAALCAAVSAAQREENADKTIVCMLTDTGERYLSIF